MCWVSDLSVFPIHDNRLSLVTWLVAPDWNSGFQTVCVAIPDIPNALCVTLNGGHS